MQIRAAIARPREPFHIEECTLDPPGPGEVLVDVEACGICHTDLLARKKGFGTPMPAVLGHEGVGRIRALGERVSGFAVGERVLMSFGACGQCPSCRARAPAYCQHIFDYNMRGQRVDGSSPITQDGARITGHFFGQSAFASQAVAATTNLVRLEPDLPAALMAPLACGVQTGMSSVCKVLDASADDSLAVFGCGTVGLAAVMAARIVGCRHIIAVDLQDHRLELARELGATHAFNPARDNLAEAIGALGGLSKAFDNTGQPAIIETAFNLLRPRGVLACAGVSPQGARLNIDPTSLLLLGRVIRGTVEGDADPVQFIPQMIGWYRQGQLPLARLVQTYAFADINQAVADMEAYRVIKPVLLMQP